MKPWQKTALRLGAAALLFALPWLVWYGAVSSLLHDMADTPYRYEDVSVSPEGTHTVTVWRSDGAWSFGPAAAKVVASSGGEEREYVTQIADDGGKGEAVICWLDSVTARVTLRGQEQRDELVIVDFAKGIDLASDRPTTKEGE